MACAQGKEVVSVLIVNDVPGAWDYLPSLFQMYQAQMDLSGKELEFEFCEGDDAVNLAMRRFGIPYIMPDAVLTDCRMPINALDDGLLRDLVALADGQPKESIDGEVKKLKGRVEFGGQYVVLTALHYGLSDGKIVVVSGTNNARQSMVATGVRLCNMFGEVLDEGHYQNIVRKLLS